MYQVEAGMMACEGGRRMQKLRRTLLDLQSKSLRSASLSTFAEMHQNSAPVSRGSSASALLSNGLKGSTHSHTAARAQPPTQAQKSQPLYMSFFNCLVELNPGKVAGNVRVQNL